MEQKFLDSEGVKHLWSKVNMQDYPNNEVLIGVINAIDETKADRSELFSGSWDDLINKPTQGIPSENIIIRWSEDEASYYFSLPSGFYYSGENIYEATLQLENSYSYIYGNVTIIGTEYAGGNGLNLIITFNSNNNTKYFESDTCQGDIFINKNNTNIELNNAILVIYSGEVLSDYVIPDTIARTLDLTTTLTEAKSYTDTAVADLVNSAPETLDTLGELATAFEENADMVATLDAAVTNKAEKSDLDNLAELVDINATNIESLQAQILPTSLILADAITGISYTIQIQNGQLVSFETT